MGNLTDIIFADGYEYGMVLPYNIYLLSSLAENHELLLLH